MALDPVPEACLCRVSGNGAGGVCDLRMSGFFVDSPLGLDFGFSNASNGDTKSNIDLDGVDTLVPFDLSELRV